MSPLLSIAFFNICSVGFFGTHVSQLSYAMFILTNLYSLPEYLSNSISSSSTTSILLLRYLIHRKFLEICSRFFTNFIHGTIFHSVFHIFTEYSITTTCFRVFGREYHGLFHDGLDNV